MRVYQSINPANAELLQVYKYDTWTEINNKLENLKAQQTLYKKTPLQHRVEKVLHLSDKLLENKQKYATLITTEMGKPITQAIAEIEKTAWMCREMANHAKEFLAPKLISSQYIKSYSSYESLGVVLAIMPWNFPFWQAFRCAVPALLVGNTVMLKHAENVPQCALAIEQIVLEIWGENYLVNSFINVEEHIDDVIEHEYIAMVSFTGSTAAGRKVAKLAGENLKKVVLELGGSDPFIVLEDIQSKEQIQWVAQNAVKGRMLNTGQSCVASKRFIVHQSIYDAFIKECMEEINKLKIGDPMDANTQIGPIAREDLRSSLHHLVKEAVLEQASIKTGCKPLEDFKGFFYQPGILENITPNALAYKEELFGPVMSMYAYASEDEAMILANATNYGLSASIWSKDHGHAESLMHKIHAGNVYINSISMSHPLLPFGGIKNSGYGKELGSLGLHEFCNIKTNCVHI